MGGFISVNIYELQLISCANCFDLVAVDIFYFNLPMNEIILVITGKHSPWNLDGYNMQ